MKIYVSMLRTAGILVCLLIGNLAGNASTILYNNGSPNQADAADISEFTAADDFSLNANSTITGATFWASANADPFLSQFSGTVGWGIYANDGGVPGTLLSSGSVSNPSLTDTGIQIFGTEEYEISISLPSISLNSGLYWLGFHEGPFGTPADGTTIYWDSTGSQTGALPMATSNLDGVGGCFQTLPENNLDLAFELSGIPDDASAAPEPGLKFPLLCLAGIGGLAVHKRMARP